MPDSKPMTQWHQLLAELFRLMLTPLDIDVQAEINVLTKPPRADILLIRRHTPTWTDEQLRFVPSGIRNSIASHILIEFKKTESLSKDAIIMLVAYHLFYCKSNHLPPKHVLPVLIVSKQPHAERLEQFGFHPTNESGVYLNKNILADNVLLLTLNELQPTLYNAFIQFFASQRKKRDQALGRIQQVGLEIIPQELYWYATSLWSQQTQLRGEQTMETLTTEQMIEDGRKWARLLLQTLPPSEILSLYNPRELLNKFEPEERLAGLQPEERLAGLQREEIIALLQKMLEGEQSLDS